VRIVNRRLTIQIRKYSPPVPVKDMRSGWIGRSGGGLNAGGDASGGRAPKIRVGEKSPELLIEAPNGQFVFLAIVAMYLASQRVSTQHPYEA
jgi:hypothetical protein